MPKDAAKMPESAWKLVFYTMSWSYSTYLLFFTSYSFFHDPPSVFYSKIHNKACNDNNTGQLYSILFMTFISLVFNTCNNAMSGVKVNVYLRKSPLGKTVTVFNPTS